MKKKLFALCMATIIAFTGCSNNSMVKNFGGDMTVELEPNQKLEMITWKDDDSLWYLTRPMNETDKAETHVFQQDSAWGLFEGTVTVVEQKTN